MAYRSRHPHPHPHPHQNHVRFVEDNYSIYTAGDKSVAEASAYGSRPHFPNLHDLFVYKEMSTGDDQKPEKVSYTKSSHQTVTYKEEDVNMEADEYIKRMHHRLELQKMMSTMGNNYNP